MRIAVLTSHPIQYYAPIFRELTKSLDLHVFYAYEPTPEQQGQAGFQTAFEWDIDLKSGFNSSVLRNVSANPDTCSFNGCDTPDIGEALRAGNFDAVITLGWHLKSLVQGIFAAKRLGLPLLVRGDSHLETPRSGVKRLIKSLAYPWLLRVFDAALFVGQRNKAYFEHYDFPSDRLFFSPHCVETMRFTLGATAQARTAFRQEHGIGPDEHIVLFAGKLLPFKRPLDIVLALSELKATGKPYRLMIAGSGPLETELRQLADDNGVNVIYLGFQNQTQMPMIYAAADVLVLPSDGQETWGLVANEALACGLPIIVSDQAGCAPDLVADGQAGRIFKMGEVAALAREIEQLALDPPSRQAIMLKSDKHSIENACAGIMEALASVTSKRPSAASVVRT